VKREWRVVWRSTVYGVRMNSEPDTSKANVLRTMRWLQVDSTVASVRLESREVGKWEREEENREE
jgi:hypothetical protein